MNRIRLNVHCVLVVALTVGLTFGLTSITYADTLDLVVLIDDAERLRGKQIPWLDNLGRLGVLQEHLDEAAAGTAIQFRYIERKKLEQITDSRLKDRQTAEKLKDIFEKPAMKKKLKLIGAEYVILTHYLESEGQVDVFLRIIEVANSTSIAQASYRLSIDNAPSSLSPLAKQLVKTIHTKLRLPLPMNDVFLVGGLVVIDAPEGWVTKNKLKLDRIPYIAMSSIMRRHRLSLRKIGNFEVKPVDMMAKSSTDAQEALIRQHPDGEYILIIQIIVEEKQGQEEIVADFSILNRKGILKSQAKGSCDLACLLIGGQQLVDLGVELDSSWR